MSLSSNLASTAITAAAVIVLAVVPSTGAVAQDATETQFTAFRPERRDATPERINALQLPDGFRLNVFARDLGNARIMAVDVDGAVYLTQPLQNRVTVLRDTDNDGIANNVRPLFQALRDVHGITIQGEIMYLAAPKSVWVSERGQEKRWSHPRVIISNLPDGGRHPNRTLAVGPDTMLYISVGSSCNACKESNPEYATLLRASLDGANRNIFARGLRNTIGFDWHPQTRQLWGFDNGSDGRGNDLPPEEFNLIEERNNYGWPYVFGKRQIDPLMDDPSPQLTKAQFAQRTTPSVLEYQAHTAPIDFKFYRGSMFPEKYRNGGFVAFRGSWNRIPPTGYKIGFVRFQNGKPVEIQDFVTGFLIEEGRAQFARLAGIAYLPDGSLLFSDDENGVIYRVSTQ
ncbi:MAG: PQQ-dependent sugar dehydrogenase [Candidatus Hydrogenedentes bacterium]|nr:PQQ-dependent sugar dehydrogenase [Candidatus Hydrogenedentota bacterium]